MAKVYINDVKDLIVKAGEIREKLALATRRIGNVHIGGPIIISIWDLILITWMIQTEIFLS